MRLSYMFYSVCSIFIISLIVILTAVIIGNKAFKRLLIIIPLTIFFVLYFLNYDFNIFIKSNFFSRHTYTVTHLDSTKVDIPLPPNSVWLFKTPTDIYYSKYDVNKCREFFNSVLKEMKQDNKISNYYYDNHQKTYTIEIKRNPNIKINLIGDGDTRRYGISNPNY